MKTPQSRPRAGRWLGLCLCLPLLAAPAALSQAQHNARPAAAALTALDAGMLKSGTSLGLVPEDVSFHYAGLRLREQAEWLMKSKAFAKAKALPMVKEALKKMEEEWKTGKDLSPARRFMNVKENQQLAELGLEMLSDEIFFVGGANVKEFVELLQTAFGAVQLAPLSALAEGQFDQESQNKARVQALLHVLSDAADEETLRVPDFALGFKIKGKENAKTQLTRLENLLGFAVAQVPQLKGKLKRSASASGDFLVFTLDGSMVPWKEIPFKEFEEDPGDFDDLIGYLKKMKLTISLGIKGDYVVLSVGESLKFVEGFGSGKSLADRTELKPLWPHADKRLSGLSYLSKEFASLSAFDVEAAQESMEALAEEWLGHLDLPEEKQEKLIEDLKKMIADLEPFMAKPGAKVGCSYLTPNGQESWSWDYSVYPAQDASKPLTLLQHLGGAPIFAVGARSRLGQESWANFAKWTQIGYGHFRDLAVPHLPDEVQEKFKEVMAWAGPLFKKLETTTRTKLLPALADGQCAFVLDGQLKSKQWANAMPEARQPVPLPELAFIWGVSDAKLLKSAMGEYREAANEFLAKGVELSGGMIPELKLPDPQSKPISGGTAYWYAMPDEIEVLGLDKQLQPAAGLSDKVACLTLSLSHAERLLKPTPLAWAKELPIDLSRPASGFVVFDHLALQDAVRPWMDYAVAQALEEAPAEEKAKIKEFAPQVKTLLESARVLRRYVSVTTLEKGVCVTHSFLEVKDVE